MSETADDLRSTFDRYVSALNRRDVAAIRELVADAVLHNGDRMTREEWWDQRVAANVRVMPDLAWRVDEVVAADDRVAVRYTDTGTPREPFGDLPPTGAAIEFSEYVFYRFVDGRIAETWSLVDAAGVRRRIV